MVEKMLISVTALLFVFSSCLSASTVDATWKGCNWLDPNNWDTVEPPIDGNDSATISSGYFAPLVGTTIVSLGSLSISGSSGSGIILADNASLLVNSPSSLYVGLTGCSGIMQVQDNTELTVLQTLYLGSGANGFGCLNVSGGVLNLETLAAGAYSGSVGKIHIANGTINIGYRIYLGLDGGDAIAPATSVLEISGGEIIFDPNSSGNEYFMIGYNSTGYSVNTINQSGGTVAVSYRLHLGDRNDNNICKYSISDGVLDVKDRFANGNNWGGTYGTPSSEFEIIGSKPNIHVGTYYQNSDSTLKVVIDDVGVEKINVDGPAIFESDAKLQVTLENSGTLLSDHVCDILEAETITVNGKAVPKLVQVGDNYFCWTHEVVPVGNREVLRIIYRAGLDESFWWVTKSLDLWLNASSIASVVSVDGTLNDGDAVSCWNDLVINDEYNATFETACQPTSGKQPLWRQSVSAIGGKSAVELDGNSTYLNAQSLEIDSNCTVFFVAECGEQTSTVGSLHRPLIAADNNPYRASGDGYGFGFTWYGDNQLIAALGDGTAEDKQGTSVSMDGQYKIYVIRRQGSAIMEIFKRQYGDNSCVQLSDAPILSRLSGFHRGYDIGANPPEHSGNSARFYLGAIAEILVFNQTLTDEELDAVSGYLYGKYF